MRSRGRTVVAAAAIASVILGGCVFGPSPSTTGPTPTAASTPPASVTPSRAPIATPAPTPSFAIAIPPESDERMVSVAVSADVEAEDGRLTVTVANETDSRIDELVLRWSTALDEALFLAPFIPSEERIREGGPPLVQDWTKWVVGPGERGEPEGTTSLGYGPLMPGATLAIEVHAEQLVSGPLEFDLQVLAGNALLRLPDGEPAIVRVEVP